MQKTVRRSFYRSHRQYISFTLIVNGRESDLDLVKFSVITIFLLHFDSAPSFDPNRLFSHKVRFFKLISL